jgi:hypothetical protein
MLVLPLQLRLMCQFVNVLDVEVLPPYTPSAAERADASLYAANVRDLYAAHTGWPLVEQSQREFTALCKVGHCTGVLLQHNLHCRRSDPTPVCAVSACGCHSQLSLLSSQRAQNCTPIERDRI